jgi:hypothetical protein
LLQRLFRDNELVTADSVISLICGELVIVMARDLPLPSSLLKQAAEGSGMLLAHHDRRPKPGNDRLDLAVWTRRARNRLIELEHYLLFRPNNLGNVGIESEIASAGCSNLLATCSRVSPRLRLDRHVASLLSTIA